MYTLSVVNCYQSDIYGGMVPSRPAPERRRAGYAMMSLKLMWFLLLLAGVAVPLSVCLSPLLAGGSMFHVKLLLLLTEYGLLLPIVLFLAWKRRRDGIAQDKKLPSRIPFRLLAAGYALVIFPVAAVLGLGVYQ